MAVEGIVAIKILSHVKMICLDNIEVGQRTEKMLHKGLRKGPILVHGEDRTDLEHNIKMVQDMLVITVLGSDGIYRGIKWE